MNKKIVIVIFLLLIIVFFIIVVFWVSKHIDNLRKSNDETISSAKVQANLSNSYQSSQIYVPKKNISISGRVDQIEGEVLIVKTLVEEQKTYSVSVGEATVIQKKELKKEAQEYREVNSADPYILADAIFKDIRQNDILNIEAGEDIEDKNSFEAKSIEIMIPVQDDSPSL